MSEVTITVERIESIESVPNADRLEIAHVAGTQTLVPKGQYQTGDVVVYFPPDICLPAEVSQRLGVQQYLRSAPFNGEKIACRVAATRLRGVPSYGFAQPVPPDMAHNGPGTDVTDYYDAVKYEPPVKVYRGCGGGTGEVWGGLAPEPANFHRYTDIQHYRKHRDLLPAGLPVRITEKIHGTNSRVGLLKVDGEWQFVAGSHKTARKQIDPEGRESVYWYPLQQENVLSLLTDLCDEQNDVILFGELFGPGVQDLDYGVPAGEIGWRLFDISVNGRYLDYFDWARASFLYDITVVPMIYSGPFRPEFVDQYTYGDTTVVDDPDSEVKSRFKGREGIVITPFVEQQCRIGRLILKSVSADYLARKGAKDDGEL